MLYEVITLLGGTARGLETRAEIGFLAVPRDGQAVRRADVDAGVALDAELDVEDGLHSYNFV